MRRRLVLSTLAVAVLAVVLLGVPLTIVSARLIRDEAQKHANREAVQIASLIDGRAGGPAALTESTLRTYTQPDRQVIVTRPGAATLIAGHPVDGAVITGQAPLNAGGVVSVNASDEDVDDQVTQVWLLVGGLIAVSIGVAVALAVVQARKLARPLDDLVETAERLGSGDARPIRRHYGVSELDRVSEVLDRSAERIATLLAAERQFATDASHQLRTPLTALSIRLDEITEMAQRADVREEAAAALVQVERLTAVVESLLARARSSRTATATVIDIGAVLDQQVREWEPAFRRVGRQVTVAGRRGLTAVASAGGLAQVISTLLDNALAHGAGEVTARARHSGRHVVLEVTDDGPGVPDALAGRIFARSVSGGSGTGLGLALARDLVEADGGRLELVSARPPIFAIFLAADTDPASRPLPQGQSQVQPQSQPQGQPRPAGAGSAEPAGSPEPAGAAGSAGSGNTHRR